MVELYKIIDFPEDLAFFLLRDKPLPDLPEAPTFVCIQCPYIFSTTIYLWLISLTASKDLSISLLKLYNDGAIGISDSFLDFASVIKTDNQFLIRSVRFMQVESLYVHSCHTTVD